jgi:hypothetical protein
MARKVAQKPAQTPAHKPAPKTFTAAALTRMKKNDLAQEYLALQRQMAERRPAPAPARSKARVGRFEYDAAEGRIQAEEDRTQKERAQHLLTGQMEGSITKRVDGQRGIGLSDSLYPVLKICLTHTTHYCSDYEKMNNANAEYAELCGLRLTETAPFIAGVMAALASLRRQHFFNLNNALFTQVVLGLIIPEAESGNNDAAEQAEGDEEDEEAEEAEEEEEEEASDEDKDDVEPPNRDQAFKEAHHLHTLYPSTSPFTWQIGLLHFTHARYKHPGLHTNTAAASGNDAMRFVHYCKQLRETAPTLASFVAGETYADHEMRKVMKDVAKNQGYAEEKEEQLNVVEHLHLSDLFNQAAIWYRHFEDYIEQTKETQETAKPQAAKNRTTNNNVVANTAATVPDDGTSLLKHRAQLRVNSEAGHVNVGGKKQEMIDYLVSVKDPEAALPEHLQVLIDHKPPSKSKTPASNQNSRSHSGRSNSPSITIPNNERRRPGPKRGRQQHGYQHNRYGSHQQQRRERSPEYHRREYYDDRRQVRRRDDDRRSPPNNAARRGDRQQNQERNN